VNKLDIAAASGAVGTITIAGVAMTSEHARGWLSVLGEALQGPTAVPLLLLAVVACLIWLSLRARRRQEECDAKFGRLEQLVLHLLQGHPDSDRIIRNWERIKTGEMSLDEILRGEIPERRRAPRRQSDARRA